MAEVKLDAMAGAEIIIRKTNADTISLAIGDGNEVCEVILSRDTVYQLITSLNFLVELRSPNDAPSEPSHYAGAQRGEVELRRF